jgi:hypothetical protein
MEENPLSDEIMPGKMWFHYTHFSSFMQHQKENLLQRHHGLAAAAGDNLAFFYVQDLVADGAVNVALLLRTNDRNQTAFE